MFFKLNKVSFYYYVNCIYPTEIQIKCIKDTVMSISNLDLHQEIDSESRLKTKIYDKRDHYNFPIVIVLFICSNISVAPTYGVYIYQLIRYYSDVIDRGSQPTWKLQRQEILVVKLKSSLQKFVIAIMRHGMSVSQKITDLFRLSSSVRILSS